MKRKVIFVNSLFPCLSETFVFDQFRMLRQAGLDFVIVSNHRPADNQVHPRMREIQGEVEYLCEAGKMEILAAHLQALLREPVRYMKALPAIFKSRERLKTTLAHFTGAVLLLRRHDAFPRPHLHAHFTYGGAAVAMWASRLSGLSYTLTLHGSDLIYDDPPDLQAKLTEACALVSISQYNVDYVQRHFPHIPASRLQVIPLGVPPLAQPAVRTQNPANALRILTVGRLSDQKAQHYLVDACAILAREGLPFRCDIVGEGPQRDFLQERIARHGLADRVRLLGPRFHHEVLALYAEYDLFVLCSIAEGMPIVIMEAMRAGLPVVATRISGIPEGVGDGGILVPPADAQALAQAIFAFASGKVDMASMVEKARKIIAEQFDIETNTLKFKAFLDRIE